MALIEAGTHDVGKSGNRESKEQRAAAVNTTLAVYHLMKLIWSAHQCSFTQRTQGIDSGY